MRKSNEETTKHKCKEGEPINIVHSLDKGLTLLEIIETSIVPITLHNLWLKLGWNKATIHRMLATFERRGYIHRDPVTRGYTLGSRIYSLYSSIVKSRGQNIQTIVKPYLNQLVQKTGESAHLALVVDDVIVYIDTVSSSEILCVNTRIGDRGPLHCTALGKAYLSAVDESQLERLLKTLRKHTDNTVTNVIELKIRLEEIRQKGYAIDNEEYMDGIRCIASTIFNQFNIPIAMIGISGPRDRLSLSVCNVFGEYIRSLALEISLQFGYEKKLDTVPGS